MDNNDSMENIERNFFTDEQLREFEWMNAATEKERRISKQLDQLEQKLDDENPYHIL